MFSPEFWSAVAALGALITTTIATWHTYNLSKFTRKMQKAEHIREIKNLWHQLDLTILNSDKRIQQIIGELQFNIEDENKTAQIYVLFAFLNIAHSLHYYQQEGTIDQEFAEAQLQAVVTLLRNDKELTMLLLERTSGYEKSFVEKIVNNLNLE